MSSYVKDVISDVKNLGKKDPTKYTIVGPKKLPDWVGLNDHIQGIALLNRGGPAGVISGSSSDGAYFVTFDNKLSKGSEICSVYITPNSPEDYDHGGGVQILNDELFVFPIESDEKKDNAIIEFIDITNLAKPKGLYQLDVGKRKSSAVGITDYIDYDGNHKVLLASYDYNDHYMDFFTCNYADRLLSNGTVPFTKYSTYDGSQDTIGNQLKTGDQFQCFALVTACDKKTVHLLGFREDEMVYIYEVEFRNLNSHKFINLGVPEVIGEFKGSDWRNGVGVRILNNSLQIFGTDKDPSSKDGYHQFRIYKWD